MGWLKIALRTAYQDKIYQLKRLKLVAVYAVTERRIDKQINKLHKKIFKLDSNSQGAGDDETNN